ncbi:hypothetical protein BJ875DRAFT_388064, partial [Amylocarpus encephaloides]
KLIIVTRSARGETICILKIDDTPPAHIVIKMSGWRTGPPDVLVRHADPDMTDEVDPNSYKFRLLVKMDTGASRYSGHINCGMRVGEVAYN